MGDRVKTNIFLALIVIFPLVDTFNGMFITYGYNIPLGTIYRVCLILYIVYGILSSEIGKMKRSILLLILPFLLMFICIIQSFFFNTSFSLLVKEFSYVVRFSLCLIIPIFAKQFEDHFSIKKLIIITLLIDLFLIGGLVIPYALGIGNSTYDGTAGFKGFYYTTNDITYAFLIMVFFIGWFLSHQAKNILLEYSLLVLYFLNMYCLVLLGTKSGLLTGAVYSCYLIFYFLRYYRSKTLYGQFFIFEFLLTMLFLFFLKGKEILMESLSSVIARFTYFKVLYQDDWTRLLLSSRNVYLKDAITQYLQDPNNHYTFFFGSGFENRRNWYERKGGLIEMDFFDMFFSYGIIGTVILLMVIFYYFQLSNYKFTNKFCLFLLFFTIIYSFFVGHVFFSALSATVLGFVGLFTQLIQKNRSSW
ncbi:O-antigen ligase family protein [Enterococcus faecium]|nr:hypothetical protein [Enterococcus faecium]EME3564986.1 O-antigen ligase family protein [Enterococcus faecium]EME7136486.1 O-antigen ligase family protein [Enterococcus faecium]EMF0359715.1 O-antigen ligase family protein [Enterococcus faecium]